MTIDSAAVASEGDSSASVIETHCATLFLREARAESRIHHYRLAVPGHELAIAERVWPGSSGES